SPVVGSVNARSRVFWIPPTAEIRFHPLDEKISSTSSSNHPGATGRADRPRRRQGHHGSLLPFAVAAEVEVKAPKAKPQRIGVPRERPPHALFSDLDEAGIARG